MNFETSRGVVALMWGARWREEEESRRVVRNYLKDSVLSPVVSKVVGLERRQKGQGRVQEFALLRERREERQVSALLHEVVDAQHENERLRYASGIGMIICDVVSECSSV